MDTKKEYCKPFIEKIEFDYTIQTANSSEPCTGITVSEYDAYGNCISGTPSYIGWNNDQPFIQP